MKFQALAATGDGGAYDIAWDILKANRDNAMMMNSIAWFVLDDANVKNRDLEFAMAAAKAANDASGGNDPAILDTLARAYFEKGDLDMAIELQQKAVDRVEGPGAAQFVETLEKYKKAANDRPA
jgi:tetratricopeptide (TPR) repeat protein